MSAKANSFKIGLFTVIAVALLVAGLLAFGAKSYFTPKEKFETAISGEVTGLAIGSGVQLRGVPVGQVTSINFCWNVYPESKSTMIVVQFEIEKALLPLPRGMDMATTLKRSEEKGMRAMIKGQGITGTSILSLETVDPRDFPPPPIDYTPKSYYIPSAPSQFSRMLESIEKSLNNFEDMNFGAIGENVTNVLIQVNKFTEKLNSIDLTGIGTNANALLVGVRETSTRLQGAIDQVQTTLKGMKLDKVSGNANELLAGLQGTNAKLKAVLEHLDEVPVDQTLGDLRGVLRTLEAVLDQLNQYPSGFIFGKPPLPVTAVQSSEKK